jgi:hypothetical protein
MDQAVSCRSLAGQARVQSNAFHMGFVVDRVALGQDMLLVLLISHVIIIKPVLHAHSFTTDAIRS